MTLDRESQPSIFIVSHPGYPFDVLVCINVTDAQVERALREHERWPDDREVCDELLMGDSEGFSILLPKTNITVLRLREFALTPRWLGRLAHEVFHAVDHLFDHLDMKLSRDSDHAYAYAIEGLTRAIFRELAVAPKKRARAVDLSRRAIIPADGVKRRAVPNRKHAVPSRNPAVRKGKARSRGKTRRG